MAANVPACVLLAILVQQPDRDTDKDGLSDFQEVHKYLTDPNKADTDGDGIPDGDWRERREYQYTVRTVVQVMRPVTIAWLDDDHQDARVLDETRDYVELEVIHYPFTTVASAITADPEWRKTAAGMKPWTAPGTTANWTPEMRDRLTEALRKDGIEVQKLDDRTLVERASRWLCKHALYQDRFTTFVTAFDDKGAPFIPAELLPLVAGGDRAKIAEQWPVDILARGMFEHGQRGSCSSSAIYLNGCLRALGIPTRIVLCIPVVDANDEQELRMLERGLTHHQFKRGVTAAISALRGSWSSHTFNEVFVGGRWRRLNYDKLGQDSADPGQFGLMTHVATFSDWADARMPETIGRRQTLRRLDDVFGGPNPYSAISLRDEFGAHCSRQNPKPEPVVARVTAIWWGDGQEAPEHVRDWFARREVFGLVARVEGPKSFAETKQFLDATDLRVLLSAAGQPTLGVGFNAGAWWWQGDHALVVVPFGAADRRDLLAGVPYRFVVRNEKPEARWQVAEGLQVVRPR